MAQVEPALEKQASTFRSSDNEDHTYIIASRQITSEDDLRVLSLRRPAMACGGSCNLQI